MHGVLMASLSTGAEKSE